MLYALCKYLQYTVHMPLLDHICSHQPDLRSRIHSAQLGCIKEYASKNLRPQSSLGNNDYGLASNLIGPGQF